MQSILGWDDPTVKNMLHESAVRVNHKGDTVTINRSKKRSLASQLHLAKALTLKANQFIESQLTPPQHSAAVSTCTSPPVHQKYLLPLLPNLKNVILPVGAATCTQRVSQQHRRSNFWNSQGTHWSLMITAPPTSHTALACQHFSALSHVRADSLLRGPRTSPPLRSNWPRFPF